MKKREGKSGYLCIQLWYINLLLILANWAFTDSDAC